VETSITFQLHTALVYHEQLKNKGRKEKAADKLNYSLQKIAAMIFAASRIKYIFHSRLGIESSPGIMHT
jgi:hypothetical protein